MWILVIIAIIAILFLYVQSVRSFNPEFEIIQVPIHRLKPSFLDEKSPVLVYSRIVTIDDLMGTTFKYRYTTKHNDITTGFFGQGISTKSRYTILHNVSPYDVLVDIIHAKHTYKAKQHGLIHENKHFQVIKYDAIIRLEQETQAWSSQQIKLPSKMVLILPFRWMFCFVMTEPENAQLQPEHIRRTFVHDVII